MQRAYEPGSLCILLSKVPRRPYLRKLDVAGGADISKQHRLIDESNSLRCARRPQAAFYLMKLQPTLSKPPLSRTQSLANISDISSHERQWQIRPPDRDRVRRSGNSFLLMMAIDQVPISIVLDHEAVVVEPIVKNLTTQDVPSNSPCQCISTLLQPQMASHLAVEIVDFETGVVRLVPFSHVSGAEEECL